MFIYQKPNDALEHIVLAEGVEVKIGTCLKLSEGGLALCGANEAPEYISNTETVGDGSAIAVQKVTPETTLSGVLAADSEVLAIGAQMSLAENGIDIAATTGGKLAVLAFDGNKAGDKVIVAVK